MDILLQQVSSGFFWSADAWVPEINRASVFSSSGQAIEFCLARRIDGARLVFHFEDSRDDIYLKAFPERRQVPDWTERSADAEIEELMAIKDSLRAHETRLQTDIDSAIADLERLNQRHKFALKRAEARRVN